MSGFRLIGIRPHKDCGSKFLKLLEPGRLYQFYNEYVFHTKDGKFDGVNGDINHYSFNQIVPNDLCKIGDLNVNISAIVGKNGTGKSTLIELLLYSKYLIGRSFKDKNTGETILLKYSDLLKGEIKEVQETYDNRTESIGKFRAYISNLLKEISRNPIGERFFKDRIFAYIDEIELLSAERLNERRRLRKLKIESLLVDKDGNKGDRLYRCSMIFLLNSHIYEMTFNEQIELYKITKHNKIKVKNVDLTKHFFYSTILNYSHHSLNSNHIGNWINSLFHKNDGYKTPAVINPMRDNGNFDINKEIELSKSRLLVNSLINQINDLEQTVPVSDKQYINSIIIKRKDHSFFKKTISLKFDKSSQTYKIHGHPVGISTIEEILNTNKLETLVTSGYSGDSVEVLENLLNYLVNKVHRIQNNYSEYFDKEMSIGIEDADQIVNDKNTIEKLNKDYSHVSFKYHRSIFFLRKIVNGELDDFFSDKKSEIVITLPDYLKQIDFLDEEKNLTEQDIYQIFLRIPPPIFEVDFNLAHSSSIATKKYSSFEELSSGEQQSIHTINTFIYHLNNAYSVHKESIGKRQKYQYFNAVFDEIELYFHPDFQRKFINNLLKTLRNNKHLYQDPFISDINILFSTHSPFILSDIPKQNILQLEYGQSELTNEGAKYSVPVNSKNQTFGANIHDLLANQFFLNNSIGEFAIEQIDQIISLYNKVSLNKQNEKIDKETSDYYKGKRLKYDFIVKNIGDDVIREVLRDQLDFIHEYFKDNEKN